MLLGRKKGCGEGEEGANGIDGADGGLAVGRGWKVDGLYVLNGTVLIGVGSKVE